MASPRAAGKDRVFLNTDPNDWGSHPGAASPLSSLLALAGFVGLSLLVGFAGAGLAGGSAGAWYLSLTAPPLTPPQWVFGPVWTVLYVLIGAAGWLVWRRAGASRPTRLWGWQLALNALWTPAFFGLHRPDLALVICVLLLTAIVWCIRVFRRVSPIATLLMLPYLAWVAFATYLNAGFWLLNPS